MQVSRDRFLNQFTATIQVCVLPSWRLRSKTWPELVPGALYRSMITCNGSIPIELDQFRAIIDPPLIELWKRLPRTARPRPGDFASFVYDVFDKAGVEIGILPPILPHGSGYGRKESE